MVLAQNNQTRKTIVNSNKLHYAKMILRLNLFTLVMVANGREYFKTLQCMLLNKSP